MISVNLATRVIFYKQLPGIAKKLDVDADFLKGFLTNTRCYVEDAGKGEVLELDNSADTITKVVAAHEKRFYGAEAIVEFAKSKGVDIPALNHFELGADISAHATENQVANITALAARVERLNNRYKSLARLEAPDVILMNEARMVREAVEQLEDNSGTYSPALDQNGVAYQSLKDIGYSLVTGWDKSVLEKNSNKDAEATFPKEPDFQRLASLVKKAIGTRTQGKFAFQAGLTRGYISSLVNGNAKAQPTENTIKKIASATDAVTENELRIACGYEPLPDDRKDKLSMQRASMSNDAWQKDNVDAFLSFLNETIPMSTPLSSTEILQALFKEKYGDKNDQILLEKVSAPGTYRAEGTAADVILPIRLCWFSFKRMLMQTLYVGLIGHYSKNDELYITGYISSVKELHDAVPALRGGIDAAYDASLPEGIDIMKFPVFYTASNVQEAYKRVQQKIVSKIDDYFASEVKVRVSGIGFYTDTLSNEKFVEFMRLHKAALTAPSAPIELRDIYENVVERHGRPEDFLVENSDFDCKASVIAYAMNNETILCAGQDIFDGMLGSKETDAENCSCVSVSDKEFARLHSKFGLKKEDVLEAIKAYAQELGLEYGPVNYFMMCDPKYANDLGEVVQ